MTIDHGLKFNKHIQTLLNKGHANYNHIKPFVNNTPIPTTDLKEQLIRANIRSSYMKSSTTKINIDGLNRLDGKVHRRTAKTRY